ncbi:MAG: CRISPR-associated protein Csx3 [Methanothrix sp.]|nr:CRISPR-associated protein Csx3 [Methanothrix sp.]
MIVEGRAPIWCYGMALHKLHPSPATAIAFYDPRLGAVVVATHIHAVTGGPGCGLTLPVEQLFMVMQAFFCLGWQITVLFFMLVCIMQRKLFLFIFL